MRCCVYQSGVSTFPAAQRRPNSCRRRFCCVSDTKIKQYLKKNEKQAGAGGLRRLVHRLLSLSFKRLRTRCKCADMYNGMHARLLNVNLELRVTPQGSPGWCLNWFGFSFLLQQKAKEWFVFHLYCSFFCKQTPKSTSCSIEERSSPKGGDQVRSATVSCSNGTVQLKWRSGSPLHSSSPSQGFSKLTTLGSIFQVVQKLLSPCWTEDNTGQQRQHMVSVYCLVGFLLKWVIWIQDFTIQESWLTGTKAFCWMLIYMKYLTWGE